MVIYQMKYKCDIHEQHYRKYINRNHSYHSLTITPPQVQWGEHHIELGSCSGKMRWKQSLGERTSYLIIEINKSNVQMFLHKSFSNEVVVNFNVFSSCMKDWVCSKVDGRHITVLKHWNMTKRDTQLLKRNCSQIFRKVILERFCALIGYLILQQCVAF